VVESKAADKLTRSTRACGCGLAASHFTPPLGNLADHLKSGRPVQLIRLDFASLDPALLHLSATDCTSYCCIIMPCFGAPGRGVRDLTQRAA
jgi:hypothetical protein